MTLYEDLLQPTREGLVADRFWPKATQPGMDECWFWTAATMETGYGAFQVRGKVILAHRVAWMLANGDIPEGMEIDHACHNADISCPGGNFCPHRSCVNPAHLEVVTHQENCRRGERGRLKDVCRKGLHPMSGDNLLVTSRGTRECRSCKRERSLKWDRRNRGVMPENYRK